MLIKRKDLEHLHAQRNHISISLFMPTYRAGFNNARIDQLKFKNLLQTARLEIEERGIAPNVSHGMLQPAYELLEDDIFWTDLSDGLALFLSPDFFAYYTLPLSFDTYHFLGNRFHIRPLLPLFTGGGRFFLLALSQNEVRFFEGLRHSITPVMIDDLIPGDLAEALQYVDGELSLQAHSGRGSSTAVFHGQGKGKDSKVKDLKKYFREIDKGLLEMLHDEQAPLLIAAVDYLVPIYQSVSNYSNIIPEFVKGNPEHWNPMQLHERAWQIMEPYFKKKQRKAAAQFSDTFPHSKASISTYDIVPSAIGGRIETLFIDKAETNLWGQYYISNHQIRFDLKRKSDSICLLNEAAAQTFFQGGTVYNVSAKEIPYPYSSMNATYRY